MSTYIFIIIKFDDKKMESLSVFLVLLKCFVTNDYTFYSKITLKMVALLINKDGRRYPDSIDVYRHVQHTVLLHCCGRRCYYSKERTKMPLLVPIERVYH